MSRAEYILNMLEEGPETDSDHAPGSAALTRHLQRRLGAAHDNYGPVHDLRRKTITHMAKRAKSHKPGMDMSNTYYHKHMQKNLKAAVHKKEGENIRSRYQQFKDSPYAKERDASRAAEKASKAAQRAKEAKQHHQDMIRHSMSGGSRQGVLDKIGGHIQSMPTKEKVKAGLAAGAVGAGALALKKIRDKRRKERKGK